MTRSLYRGATALALLAGIAAVGVRWYAWSTAVDPIEHEAHLGRIRRIETLGHRLNEQVLRAHDGLSGSYDPLVHTMRELADLHEAVHSAPRFVDARPHQDLDGALAACVAVLEAQDDLVERFKTDNAVLRNSLRYFPTAAAELSRTLDETPGLEAEAAALRGLLRDVLQLAVDASAATAENVTRDLEALRPHTSGDPRLRSLVRHVEVIVERSRAVDAHLRAILAQPSSTNARALEVEYLRLHGLAVSDAELLRNAIAALLFLALVAAAASIILRLDASARALRATSDKLGQAIDRQNRFVSMTSHEFRTPLSVIVSSAELLEAYAERWTVEQQKKHLKKIERSARGMTDLLDGLLLIGRSDAGHRDFRPAPVDLDALALETVEAQRNRAKDGIQIELEPSRDGSPVRLDSRLVRHVLDNLVSNGVKYSKAGGIVRVRVERDASQVRLVVDDDGIGIPAPDLERLFETFHRAKNVGTISGTGLGLAVVKRAVEQHGGTIRVSSDVGRGTSFEVTLPVDVEPAV